MKTIILRLDNSSIYLNDFLRLCYSQSNLPKSIFKLGSQRLIFLEVDQISFDKKTGTLNVKVVNYSPSNFLDFNKQSPKYQINRIEFEKMDWQQFGRYVSSYRLNSELESSFYNIFPSYSSALGSDSEISSQKGKWDIEKLRKKDPNLFLQSAPTPMVKHLQTVVKVKFEDATFGDGHINFLAKVKELKISRDFFIENKNLKREFENIKPWFEKTIGKFFIATIRIKLVDNQLSEANAFSEEILAINENLIESIKIQRVLMLVNTKRLKEDNKVVFNNDEVFGVLDEGQGTNVFDSSANYIIEVLIKKGLAKNIRQLEFLSKEKHSLNEKVRFTLKPLFGFLFKVQTQTKQFYIWELLNSHATYVWEREINDCDFYQFIEQELSFIKANGRGEYRRYYKNMPSKEFNFHIIEHDGEDLTEVERFHTWRNKLEALH